MKNITMERVVNSCLFLAPVLSISFHNGVTLMLVASFIVWLVWGRKQDVKLLRVEKYYFLFTVLVSVVGLSSLILAGFPEGGGRELEKYLRLSFCAPLIIILASVTFRQYFFWLGIAVAAVYAGVVATIDIFVLGTGRANSFGMLNPIFFGGFSILLAFLSFMAACVFYKDKKTAQSILCILGVGGGMVAVVLSGSRGGLLALPVLAVTGVCYLAFSKHFKLLLVAVVASAAVVGVVATQDLAIKQRVDVVESEVSAYISHGVDDTSVGVRLYMWEMAWHGFLTKPLMGHGPGNFKELPYKSVLRDDFSLEKNSAIHSHAHSEYLHTMATKGALGLLALLGVFCIPLGCAVFFIRQGLYEYGFSLLGVVSAFMTFSLTDSVLMRGSGVDFFTVLTCVFMVLGFRCMAIKRVEQ